MVNFLDDKLENAFRRFVNVELAEKYQQPIFVEDAQIVTGLMGNDKIEEALIVRFFVGYAKVGFVEDKISADIHKYCYENGFKLDKSPVIKRDTWNGEIRYGLVYTNPEI